jgi:hypothetical protein
MERNYFSLLQQILASQDILSLKLVVEDYVCEIQGVLFLKKSINIQKVRYRVDIKRNPDVRVLLETCPEGWGFN